MFSVGQKVRHLGVSNPGKIIRIDGPFHYDVRFTAPDGHTYDITNIASVNLEAIDTEVRFKLGDKVMPSNNPTIMGEVTGVHTTGELIVYFYGRGPCRYTAYEAAAYLIHADTATSCHHQLAEYVGLFETYNYCKHCGVKESEITEQPISVQW